MRRYRACWVRTAVPSACLHLSLSAHFFLLFWLLICCVIMCVPKDTSLYQKSDDLSIMLRLCSELFYCQIWRLQDCKHFKNLQPCNLRFFGFWYACCKRYFTSFQTILEVPIQHCKRFAICNLPALQNSIWGTRPLWYFRQLHLPPVTQPYISPIQHSIFQLFCGSKNDISANEIVALWAEYFTAPKQQKKRLKTQNQP